MGDVLQLEQAPASLLGEKDAAPPITPPSTATDTPPAPAAAFYDEGFARQLVLYVCKSLADLTGEPLMQASAFELALVTPPLTAAINKYAPRMAAGDGSDPTVVILAIGLLVMVGRRGAILRRRAIAKKGEAAAAAAELATAAPHTPPPTASANGHAAASLMTLGGQLGNGQL